MATSKKLLTGASVIGTFVLTLVAVTLGRIGGTAIGDAVYSPEPPHYERDRGGRGIRGQQAGSDDGG